MADAQEVIESVSRGQHGMLDPALLPAGYASRFVNVTVRDGLPRSRPGIVGSTFPYSGRFQGAFEYRLNSGSIYVFVVTGKVYTYVPTTGEWKHIDTFPTTDFQRAWFVQADKFCIIQNGIYEPENWPIILDGTDLVNNLEISYKVGTATVKVKDADYPAATRVPIGQAMAFGHGRLFVAVDRFWDNGVVSGESPSWKSGQGTRFILAGDIMRVDSVDRLLVFTETEYLNEGQAMGLPAEFGFITAMTMFRNAATGSGLGQLIVAAQRGFSAFAINIPRRQWKSQDIAQALFSSSGSRSPWSFTQINSDILYVGEDGAPRTVKYTASTETASGGLASVPVLPEAYNAYRHTKEDHLGWVSMAHADNYVLTTAGSVETSNGDVAFRGLAVWDVAQFQVSGETPARVCSGVWGGSEAPFIYAVLPARGTEGLPKGFYIVYRATETGELRLGKITDGQTSQAVSSVRARTYLFKDPRSNKRMKYVDLMFDEVMTDLYVWFRWRVEGQGEWSTSSVRKFTVPAGSVGCTRLFRVPVANPNHTAVGTAVQVAIEWKGTARFRYAFLSAGVLDAFSGDATTGGAMCTQRALAGVATDYEFDVPLPEGVAP